MSINADPMSIPMRGEERGQATRAVANEARLNCGPLGSIEQQDLHRLHRWHETAVHDGHVGHTPTPKVLVQIAVDIAPFEEVYRVGRDDHRDHLARSIRRLVDNLKRTRNWRLAPARSTLVRVAMFEGERRRRPQGARSELCALDDDVGSGSAQAGEEGYAAATRIIPLLRITIELPAAT